MRWRRLWAMAVKETLQIRRDPRSLAVALLMPLMQMAILGYGVSLDIRHVPLCVQDREHSAASRQLVDTVLAGGWFELAASVPDDSALRRALDDGRCRAALVLPIDLSRQLASSGSATVQAVIDASDTNTGNIAEGYLEGALAQANAAIRLQWAQSRGLLPSARGQVDARPSTWFNETLDSRNFIIPGVIAVILALVGAQLTSLTVSREWERGTMEQLIATPLLPLEIMLGKLLPYLLIGLADALICLLLAVAWFQVPLRGGLGALFVATLLFSLVVLGIGYLISVRVRTQLGASQLALLVTMLPTTLLSGYTFPIDQMPRPIQALTLLVYPRYFVTLLRAIFLKGSGLLELWQPLLALTVFAVIIVALATRAFRKSLD